MLCVRVGIFQQNHAADIIIIYVYLCVCMFVGNLGRSNGIIVDNVYNIRGGNHKHIYRVGINAGDKCDCHRHIGNF